MRKLLLIAFKDFRLVARDRAALVLMLLAPFLLTLGLGAVTGRFSGASASGISRIPVVLANLDRGPLGSDLVAVLRSDELHDLVDPTLSDDLAAARRTVDPNKAVALIVIPAGFTDSVIPPQGQAAPAAAAPIELYANPTAPTSVGVVKTVLDRFASQVEVGRVAGQVAVTQLLASGRIRMQDTSSIGLAAGVQEANAAEQESVITLSSVTPSGRAVPFDVLAVLAPGMALMFLMYTASNGSRTILTERNHGTLPRLVVSPTRTWQILGGKMIGIYLTGVVQMFVLIFGMALLFRIQWGDSYAVQALVLAAVFGAVGWGMIVAALAKTPGQVNAVGTAIMLTFGILGGTFVDSSRLPAWFRTLTKVTPNAWGVEGFTTLALGGGLRDVVTPIFALLVMGLVLFALALLLIRRRGLADY